MGKIMKFVFIFVLFLNTLAAHGGSEEVCSELKSELLALQKEQYAQKTACPQMPAQFSSMDSENPERLRCLNLAQLQSEHDDILAQMNLLHGLQKVQENVRKKVDEIFNLSAKNKFKELSAPVSELEKNLQLLSAMQTLAKPTFKMPPNFEKEKNYQGRDQEFSLTEHFARTQGAGIVDDPTTHAGFVTFVGSYCTEVKREVQAKTTFAQGLSPEQVKFCQFFSEQSKNEQWVKDLTSYVYDVLEIRVGTDIGPILTHVEAFKTKGPLLAQTIKEEISPWADKAQELVNSHKQITPELEKLPLSCFKETSPTAACTALTTYKENLQRQAEEIIAMSGFIGAGDPTHPKSARSTSEKTSEIKSKMNAALEEIKTKMAALNAVTDPSDEIKVMVGNILKEKMVPQWKGGLTRQLDDLQLQTRSLSSTVGPCQALLQSAVSARGSKSKSVEELGADDPARNLNCNGEDPDFFDKLKTLQEKKIALENDSKLPLIAQMRKTAEMLKTLGLCEHLSELNDSEEAKIIAQVTACTEESDFEAKRQAKFEELQKQLKKRQGLLGDLKGGTAFREVERMKKLTYSALRQRCPMGRPIAPYENSCLSPNDPGLENVLILVDESNTVLGALEGNNLEQDFREVCRAGGHERIPLTCTLHQDWHDERLAELERQDEAAEEAREREFERQERRQRKKLSLARRIKAISESYYDHRTGQRKEFQPGTSIMQGAAEGIAQFAQSGMLQQQVQLMGAHQSLYAQAKMNIQEQRLRQQQEAWMVANGIFPYGPIRAPGGINPSVGGYPMLLPRPALTPSQSLLGSGGRPDLFYSGQNYQYNPACVQGVMMC